MGNKRKTSRTCEECNETKPLSQYHRRPKKGRLYYRRKCRDCTLAAKRKRYADDLVYREHTKSRSIESYARRKEDAVAQKAEYREENREKINESKVKAYHSDLEKSRKIQRDCYAADPDSAKKRREYRAENIERERLVAKMYREKKGDELREKRRVWLSKWKESNREKYNEKSREYYRSNINRKIGMNLRNRVNATVRYRSGVKKRESLRFLIDCTINEFKIQFEAKFTRGMSWKKFLAGEIHIDHIRPCASFDLTKELEQRKCFHYSNLQPLWAKDNLSKGAKYNQ